MHIDGRCHCGAIAYEAEVDPASAKICHCTDCQTLSGSAFRTVVFTREGTFALRQGRLATYVKTAESGRQREQGFCPTCGTPVYSTAPGDGPKVHALRLGTVRQRDRIVPRLQTWHRSAQGWIGKIGEMAAKARE